MAANAAAITALANSSAENKLYDTEKKLSYPEFISDMAVFCSALFGTAGRSKLTIFYMPFSMALRYNKTMTGGLRNGKVGTAGLLR